MSDKRQKNQLKLAFMAEGRNETPRSVSGGTEALMAERRTESPAKTDSLMEEILDPENLRKALKRVKANKGSAGVDRITVDRMPDYLKQHWPVIREQLLEGTYKPQPVLRVEIPKPDGGVRKLGIPVAVDRFLQQAVMQVLQSKWDPTFSEHSFGFRPNRSARQAVARAQEYIVQGYTWVVDLDLEKFFDRVNHDKLMGLVAKRITDKRVLKLIRAFLNAGVMENGLVSPSVEGTPQGGSAFATAQQPSARRTRPGTGAPGPLLCSLCGR
jgi:RNA-directed DNA polymerase